MNKEKFDFGKYKNTLLIDCGDIDYLAWCCVNRKNFLFTALLIVNEYKDTSIGNNYLKAIERSKLDRKKWLADKEKDASKRYVLSINDYKNEPIAKIREQDPDALHKWIMNDNKGPKNYFLYNEFIEYELQVITQK